MIVMGDDGTVEEKVDIDESTKFCLTDDQALKLAKLSIELEEAFRSARDIEFAIKNDSIYLLQSRPITSFSAWTDFELEHEFDTAVSSSKDLVSKGNVGYKNKILRNPIFV